MLRTIQLTPADIDEPEALIAVDDEGRRPSDIKSGEPETVVDAIAFDHRAIRIDKHRKVKSAGMVIISHFLGTLADDHHHLGSQGLIGWQMGLQLLQLLAAVRSPGPTNEDNNRRAGADDVC